MFDPSSGLRSDQTAYVCGKICDEGHTVTFSDVLGVVHSKQGEEICKFHRTSGDLYLAKLRLRSQAGFARSE